MDVSLSTNLALISSLYSVFGVDGLSRYTVVRSVFFDFTKDELLLFVARWHTLRKQLAIKLPPRAPFVSFFFGVSLRVQRTAAWYTVYTLTSSYPSAREFVSTTKGNRSRARFIESEKLNSNRENIEVYGINLDVISIGNQCFAFKEPDFGLWWLAMGWSETCHRPKMAKNKICCAFVC